MFLFPHLASEGAVNEDVPVISGLALGRREKRRHRTLLLVKPLRVTLRQRCCQVSMVAHLQLRHGFLKLGSKQISCQEISYWVFWET